VDFTITTTTTTTTTTTAAAAAAAYPSSYQQKKTKEAMWRFRVNTFAVESNNAYCVFLMLSHKWHDFGRKF